jgi:hypothetical protein
MQLPVQQVPMRQVPAQNVPLQPVPAQNVPISPAAHNTSFSKPIAPNPPQAPSTNYIAPSAPATQPSPTARAKGTNPNPTRTASPQQSTVPPPAPLPEKSRLESRRNKKKIGILASAGARLAERVKQARRMPAWMVSFIFHLLMIIILALIPIPGMDGSAITLFLGSGDTTGIPDFELSGGNEALSDSDQPEVYEVSETPRELSQILVTATPLSTTKVAEAKSLDVSSLMRVDDANANFGDIPSETAASILSNGLRGRRGEQKADLLRRGGGSAETEDAVEQGLIWLSKQQRSDGSWSLKGPYDDGGVHENTVAATGMALNAFLGAGYHQLEGKYAGNVQRGLRYLLSLQNDQGFFTTGKEQGDQRAYAQAIATITILEAYGLSGEYKLRDPCMKAVKYAEWAQSKLKGWRYQPRTDADLSVTGWFVMALESAKLVGFEIDEPKLQDVHEFLDSVAHRQKAAYAYNDLQDPDLTMTAEGLLCRIWLGWSKTQPALLAGVEELVNHIPSEQDRTQSIYYWYYATQVVHHFGGDYWEQWNQEMKRALPAMQEKNGDEKGSWPPTRDVYGVAGGRLYTTALAIYCLEVYYRHLAIYDNQ